MTKAHNLINWMKEKRMIDQKDEDTAFFITLYNLSDKEFDIAIQDPVEYDLDDHGLYSRWD